MQSEQVFLGIVKDIPGSFISNKKLYLRKHAWMCDWFWSFGWIGNENLHCHVDSEIIQKRLFLVTDLFKSTNISETDWYIICDLFIQAYSLHRAYSVYYRGNGSICTNDKCKILNQNDNMSHIIKNDLELILNKIWEIVINI